MFMVDVRFEFHCYISLVILRSLCGVLPILRYYIEALSFDYLGSLVEVEVSHGSDTLLFYFKHIFHMLHDYLLLFMVDVLML